MKNQFYKQDEDLKKNESRGLRKNYNEKNNMQNKARKI